MSGIGSNVPYDEETDEALDKALGKSGLFSLDERLRASGTLSLEEETIILIVPSVFWTSWDWPKRMQFVQDELVPIYKRKLEERAKSK